VQSRPDGEPEPEPEQGEPQAGSPGTGIDVVTPEGPEAGSYESSNDDQDSDAQLPDPQNAPALGGERRDEPVGPERRPPEREHQLDHVHVTDVPTRRGDPQRWSLGIAGNDLLATEAHR
jgi:hypothetical protein